MADKVKLFLQKRTLLKSQITLSNLLDKGRIDGKTLRLRITRLTELYHAFEEYNDELMVLDPSDVHQSEFSNIQERFYTLAGNVENKLSAMNITDKGDGISSDEIRIENTEIATMFRKRRVKLPEAPLLTFDGKFENWLTFKNAFSSMIGAQTDLTDVDKLHYLKSALTYEAGNKIKIFSIDGVSYTKAWELLERSTGGLTKLADDAQQHIAALNTLGVTVGQEMIVYLIESKLPKITLDKWQVTLVRDIFPKLEDLYEFLYKTAVCASIRERPISIETNKSKYEPPIKKRKFDAPNRVFVVKASRNCIACKGKRHPLYTYNAFKQLAITERIDMVRKAKLCYNCLRSNHGVPCKFSNYQINTVCQKRYNILLHNDNHANKAELIPRILKLNDNFPARVISATIKLVDPEFHLPRPVEILGITKESSETTKGRLQRSKLTFAQKHPILLPNRNHLTDVIIRETHESNHHAGIQQTLAAVRQKFWVLDGRNQVRKVVRKCICYFRFNSNTVEPKMGNLPIARVSEAIPFSNTGVDFCGPFYMKERKFRNRTRIKIYVCIFVCMYIKGRFSSRGLKMK
ncbi:hypothetical protein ALC57_10816 [Trachymyrmex cornetzi]|uniref:Integrase zinc-binding domain-containing protein n=1 Tax=Trachymyrmex cornetzi TaxID=471704 RepID=A0A151J374_9HYME|nr:hypothetical protein ALC57_10816 [Trachymyrmex cornetzi]